jgi:hypothetical protein
MTSYILLANFTCDNCGGDLQTKNDLKLHDEIMHKKDSWNSMVYKKEKELLEQRLNLMTKILNLKEMETKADQN